VQLVRTRSKTIAAADERWKQHESYPARSAGRSRKRDAEMTYVMPVVVSIVATWLAGFLWFKVLFRLPSADGRLPSLSYNTRAAISASPACLRGSWFARAGTRSPTGYLLRSWSGLVSWRRSPRSHVRVPIFLASILCHYGRQRPLRAPHHRHDPWRPDPIGELRKLRARL